MTTDLSSLHVLCVDDDGDYVDLTATVLERERDDFSVTTATSVREGITRLDDTDIDCVVSDYDMPGQSGLDFLNVVREEYDDLPFILFTGKGSEEIASEAISSGVTEYMQKEAGLDQYTVLANRIENAVAQHRAERQLDVHRRRFQLLVEEATDVIVVVEPDGTISFASPSAESVLGRSPEDLVGSDGFDPIHPEDVDRVKSEFATLAEHPGGRRHVEFRYRRPDGTWIWAEARGRNLLDTTAVGGIVVYTRDITDRREREQRFRSVFEEAFDAIVIADDSGEYIAANSAACELFGLERDELLGRSIQEFTPADVDFDATWRAFQTSERDRGTFPIERPDGATRLIEYAATADIVPGEHLSILRDVTERERQQRERERIIERVTDAIVTVDRDWRFTLVDPRAEEIYGTSEEELLGRELWEVFPDALGTRFEAEYRAAMEAREPTSLVEYYPGLDGWFSVNVYPDETGGLSFYFRDVTDQKEREQTLRSLYETTADPDLSFDEKLEQLLNLGRERLGLPYGFVTNIDTDVGEQRIIEASGSHRLIQPGESCPLSEAYCRKTIETDGLLGVQDAVREGWDDDPAYEAFGLGSYVGAKLIVGDELYGTFCFAGTEPREAPFSEFERTFVELTAEWVSYELERNQREQELEQHNERLEEFASIVSHDLRNPLNVIQGSIDLAQETGDVSHLDRSRRAATRMEHLIDDLLSLARRGESIAETESVNLGDLTEGCWSTIETMDATLRVDTERVVEADASRLQQLLENLLRNAIEHGGRDVAITIGDVEGGFYVEDTGPGIPEERRDTVLESGYSTADEGTGFGLSIVRQVVDAHGWDMRITDGSDGGARFEITGVA